MKLYKVQLILHGNSDFYGATEEKNITEYEFEV